jgi:RND family efflux transporter MFP subunit
MQLTQASAVLQLAIFAMIPVVGCGNKSDPSAAAAPQAMPVKTQATAVQQVGNYTEFIATLKSRNASVLQPQVEGQITRILAKSGDRVQAGQPLIEIDPRKQQATVNSQEATRRSRLAALELSRKELERRKQLHAEGVISRQDLDQAESNYDAAKAEVDALAASVREQQVELRYYSVKAPTDGIVGDIPVRVGDRVTTSTILTTMDQTGNLEAYISVPAEKASDVRLGLPVEILGNDDKPAMRTKVTFISPRIDSESQLLLVKAAVPNQQRQFRNDQIVHTRVIWEEVERPVVPITAVSRMSGLMFVFVTETSGSVTVAKQRSIRVGDIVGNNYVILDGLKPGEKIVTTGVQMLVDGMPVAPQS